MEYQGYTITKVGNVYHVYHGKHLLTDQATSLEDAKEAVDLEKYWEDSSIN